MQTEASVIARTETPVTQRSLGSDLRALGLEAGGTAIVHASLSAFGWVVGGAQAVVAALLEVVGDRGTLVMPSMSSHVSEPARWQNPPIPEAWREIVRNEMPAYDAALTPTRAMGAIADCFLRHPRTVRSPHPIVSFAANGPLAKAITADHPLSPALGETSPLARLYERDARILLLGVGHERNTSLHLAEHRAVWPSKRHYTEGTAVVMNGERRWISYNELDLNDTDFPAIGESFAACGSARTGAVGQAAAILCEQRALIDFATEWMSANRI